MSCATSLSTGRVYGVARVAANGSGRVRASTISAGWWGKLSGSCNAEDPRPPGRMGH